MTELIDTFLVYTRPHGRRLHSVARQYVERDTDAEDLVQETLMRAWKHFSKSDEGTYRRAWLFVIMRNVVIDWQRLAGRRVRLASARDTELTEIASPEPSEALGRLPALSEDAFREFLDDKILSALDALDPQFREVIVLSVTGDLSYREIADVLDCPVGTVMSRMARARRSLRDRLVDHAASRPKAREGRT